jgi:HPt (histidine-containing phosphotransfer) domain-containing protein
MSDAAPPEFDWSQAESLLGDDPAQVPQDMADIVIELVQSSEARFQELKAMNPATDRVAIAASAHQLRGSLLNFGFTGVAEPLLHVEKKPYDDAEYPALMQKAEVAFRSSLDLLSSRYPSLRFS